MNITTMSPEIEDARADGFAAARAGEHCLTCPHPLGSLLRRAWMDGFKLARAAA
jgi:hypothetical protein